MAATVSYDINELKHRIGHLPKSLREHIERVEAIAGDLAHAHDVEKVRVAALLHDLARAKRPEELLTMARGFELCVGDLEQRLPVFIHGPVGAEIARRDYGIDDPEVLEAIRFHTIGSTGLGPVAKVLFLADKLDPTKDVRYPFNSQVRDLATHDLDAAILAFIDGDITGHLTAGRLVHPLTIKFRNELLPRS